MKRPRDTTRSGGRRAGFALPTALMVFLLILGMALAFSQSVMSELDISASHGFATQTYHVAESGLELGWWKLYRDAPATQSISVNESWTPSSGVFAKGRVEVEVAATETTATGNAAYGDVRLESTATLVGYGRAAVADYALVLAAIAGNLANDDDANPTTEPLMSASSELDAASAAAMANDADAGSAWSASSSVSEWLAVDFGSSRRLRKAVFVLPDDRVTAYTLQTKASASATWTDVSGASDDESTTVEGHVLAIVFDATDAVALRMVFDTVTAAPSVREVKVYTTAERAVPTG